MLGGVWTLGTLVRRRTEGADAAGGVVADLATTDPAVRAARLVAEERARLAGEALTVVRAAVESMLRHAEAARADLNPAALAGIQADGQRAVAELRRLLGLLRSEQTSEQASNKAEPDQPDVTAGQPAARRPPWRADALVALGAGVIVLTEAATIASEATWVSVTLTLALCGSLALRRTDAVLACLAAVASTALAVVLTSPLLCGMEPLSSSRSSPGPPA